MLSAANREPWTKLSRCAPLLLKKSRGKTLRFPAPEMRSLISCDSVECRKWRQVPTFFIQVFLLGFRKFFRWISLLFTGLALERLGLTSNYLTSIIPSEVGELK